MVMSVPQGRRARGGRGRAERQIGAAARYIARRSSDVNGRWQRPGRDMTASGSGLTAIHGRRRERLAGSPSDRDSVETGGRHGSDEPLHN